MWQVLHCGTLFLGLGTVNSREMTKWSLNRLHYNYAKGFSGDYGMVYGTCIVMCSGKRVALLLNPNTYLLDKFK